MSRDTIKEALDLAEIRRLIRSSERPMVRGSLEGLGEGMPSSILVEKVANGKAVIVATWERKRRIFIDPATGATLDVDQ